MTKSEVFATVLQYCGGSLGGAVYLQQQSDSGATLGSETKPQAAGSREEYSKVKEKRCNKRYKSVCQALDLTWIKAGQDKTRSKPGLGQD